MAEFAREEIATLSEQIERETQLLKVLLLPKDPLDEKNIMVEARSAASCPMSPSQAPGA